MILMLFTCSSFAELALLLFLIYLDSQDISSTLVVFLVEKFEGLATFVFEIAMKKKEKINLESVHTLGVILVRPSSNDPKCETFSDPLADHSSS